MAQYIYKNTHFFPVMDPRRIIKMSWKVLYAVWGPTACFPMTFVKFATRGCDRKPPWKTNFT